MSASAHSGSVTVPIYRCRWRRKKTRKTYTKHVVAWRDAAGRHKEQYAKLETAKSRAQQIANDIANGETSMLTFSQADRAAWLRCQQLMQHTGRAPELACSVYTQLLKILGDACPIEAAKHFMLHQAKPVQPKTCPEIRDEMLPARERDGASANTVADLKSRLGRFCKCKTFQVPIMSVTGRDLAEWLRGLPVSRRTRNNYRDAIRELYRYAREANYVPKAWAPLDEVPRAKNETVRIEIFTPEEATKLLAAARSRDLRRAANKPVLPYLAVAMFAGVRHEELSNGEDLPVLDWRDVDLDDKKEIHVRIEVARKIGHDRLCPIQPNLREWLLPYRQNNGPVCEFANVTNVLAELAQESRTRWKDNGPRKSFISYRLAITQNIGTVAEEAGTSPERIRHNYKKTVPKREADRYFNLWPTQADVLQIPLSL